MNQYEDIIELPHHVSQTHPQMSLVDRAAQFSPFAALTGHEAAIQETARLTEERIELEENSKELLDEKLLILKECLKERPEISITYFVPDMRKKGGSYQTMTGIVHKLNGYERRLSMEDGTEVSFSDIYAVEGAIFGILEDYD